MQVTTTNIIRFPFVLPASVQQATPPTRWGGKSELADATIVGFPPDGERDPWQTQVQEHGQLFAAHRIVGRVVDQLDRLPGL